MPLPSRPVLQFAAVVAALMFAGCPAPSTKGCPDELTQCGDVCRDTRRDPSACGACDVACGSGLACVGGQCVLVCGGGTTKCGEACVDTRLDPANCGACGAACPGGQVCSNSACANTCAAGLGTCGADGGATFCANTASDNANCGACARRCAAGEVCASGSCATSCPATQVNCGGACVDGATDRAHCGARLDCAGGNAGAACAAGEVCASGSCATSCPATQVNCGGSCVDPDSDRVHCGATADCQGPHAGIHCAPGLVCAAGACSTGLPALVVDGGARFVDGGFTASGIPLFVNVGEPPVLGAAGDLPIERVRGFTCDEAAAAASPEVSDVAGAAGELLFITPSGTAPCTFHLAHRGDGGVETRLSVSPSGYLVASAAAAAGLTMACASDAMHYAVPGGPATAREVHQVPIRCWASAGTTWTQPLEVVAADLNHAAWVVSVVPEPATSGAFTLTFTRDSTFQFLNLSDFGRPGTDGTWSVPLTLVGNSVVAGAATQLSPSVHSSPANSTAWEPTPAEQAHYAGLMDFDAGPCAGGCLLDAGLPDAGP